jgi:hypothetical protein
MQGAAAAGLTTFEKGIFAHHSRILRRKTSAFINSCRNLLSVAIKWRLSWQKATEPLHVLCESVKHVEVAMVYLMNGITKPYSSMVVLWTETRNPDLPNKKHDGGALFCALDTITMAFKHI